jgi:hypothetical protein
MTSGRGDLLAPSQAWKAIAIGLAFWYAAALFVRYAGPAGYFDGGLANAITFAGVIPASWLTVWIVKRAAGLQPPQVVPGLALATGAAALCDGLALTWMPSLYATGTEPALHGAAGILWGVGWILGFAILDSRRST